MYRRWFGFALVVAGFFLWPTPCSAPLVYVPGEGWTYESPGGGPRWRRARAKDQYEFAQEAFDAGKYRLAIKAARRTVSRWPLSEYAPEAQYLVGRAYEARRWDEKAFKEYQTAVEKYPKLARFEEILERQFGIAMRFLGGQWFKLWGVIPFFPSKEKTADMFAKIARNGPFSKVGPQAQLALGATREKQKDYALAVQAYEKAADTYHEQPEIAAEALFRAGQAYLKQARTAEYDQGAAVSAIATFTDFIALYPQDPRVEEARKTIAELRQEQARGAFRVAQYYDKNRRWDGARVYYNEVVSLAPNSELADQARRRLDLLRRVPVAPASPRS